MKRAWDAQLCPNPWLSVGIHVDHLDPSITIHLPGLIVAVGNLKQPGFRSYGDQQRAAAGRYKVIKAAVWVDFCNAWQLLRDRIR